MMQKRIQRSIVFLILVTLIGGLIAFERPIDANQGNAIYDLNDYASGELVVSSGDKLIGRIYSADFYTTDFQRIGENIAVVDNTIPEMVENMKWRLYFQLSSGGVPEQFIFVAEEPIIDVQTTTIGLKGDTTVLQCFPKDKTANLTYQWYRIVEDTKFPDTYFNDPGNYINTKKDGFRFTSDVFIQKTFTFNELTLFYVQMENSQTRDELRVIDAAGDIMMWVSKSEAFTKQNYSNKILFEPNKNYEFAMYFEKAGHLPFVTDATIGTMKLEAVGQASSKSYLEVPYPKAKADIQDEYICVVTDPKGYATITDKMSIQYLDKQNQFIDDKTNSVLDTKEGMDPRYTFHVEDITKTSPIATYNQQFNKQKEVLQVFDVYMEDENKQRIDVDGKELKIIIPLVNDKAKEIGILDVNDKIEICNKGSIENNKAVVEINRLGRFTVIGDVKDKEDPDQGGNSDPDGKPDQGGNSDQNGKPDQGGNSD